MGGEFLEDGDCLEQVFVVGAVLARAFEQFLVLCVSCAVLCVVALASGAERGVAGWSYPMKMTGDDALAPSCHLKKKKKKRRRRRGQGLWPGVVCCVLPFDCGVIAEASILDGCQLTPLQWWLELAKESQRKQKQFHEEKVKECKNNEFIAQKK